MYGSAYFIMLLIALGLTSVELAGVRPLPAVADMRLMKFMADTRIATQANPSLSVQCFGYYMPILNEITSQLEKDFLKCADDADAARKTVDDSTEVQRNEVETTASGACELYESCNSISISTSYFECYVNAGTENSKQGYDLSQSASKILAEIVEKYRLIQNSESACRNASDNTYVVNTATTYEDLNKCLTGKSPVPSTTVATTVATTEASTAASTAAPTEASTAAPTEASTEASTAAPTEASTAAPTAAPAEASTAAPAEASTAASAEASTAAPTEASTAAPAEASTAAPTEASTAAPTEASAVTEATAAPEAQSQKSFNVGSSEVKNDEEQKESELQKTLDKLRKLLGGF